MSYEHWIAAAFRMDEATWRRHANPWSVWTRMAILPPLVLAIWSRVWFGWWSLLPIGLLVVWIWLNPRIFPPPKTTNSWASKAVLGERLWLDRRNSLIPRHHRIAAHILSGVSFLGAATLTWGLITLQIWPTILGTVIAYLGKLWFIDRMVWLFDEVGREHPAYREWLY